MCIHRVCSTTYGYVGFGSWVDGFIYFVHGFSSASALHALLRSHKSSNIESPDLDYSIIPSSDDQVFLLGYAPSSLDFS